MSEGELWHPGCGRGRTELAMSIFVAYVKHISGKAYKMAGKRCHTINKAIANGRAYATEEPQILWTEPIDQIKDNIRFQTWKEFRWPCINEPRN